MKRILKFFHNDKPSGLEKVADKDEYFSLFKGKTINADEKHHKAYEKAWDARKFEIDNYWKRTTYFWAFQIISFTGYLGVLNSASYNSVPVKNPEVLFCIITVGYLTAISWALINIGSKFWQRHWEKHIDMLEDEVTGPLYKTLYAHKTNRTFSVSKINEMISRYFVIIWTLLGLKYFIDHLTICGDIHDFAWIEFIAFLSAIIFTYGMFNGYGRGNFGTSDFKYFKRKVFK